MTTELLILLGCLTFLTLYLAVVNFLLERKVENLERTMDDLRMRDITLQQSPKAQEMLNKLVAELDKACKKD